MKQKYQWRFEKKDDNFPERTPTEDEFFREGDVCENLVRESVQNAIDAKKEDSEHVKVRFTFSEVDKEKVKNHSESLEPHIESCQTGQEHFKNDPQRVLAVEDFGTTGLTGKTSISELTEEEKQKKAYGNFIGFFRKESESGKGGTNLGRWGLGKTTFHMSSAVRSFWGLTVRDNEKKEQMILGKALLEPHETTDDEGNIKRWNYAGIYGDEGLEPIMEQDYITEFKSDFNLSRAEDETGFSVVVPCLNEKIRPDKVIRDAIRNYFYAIATGKLVIEVVDKTNGRERTTLNSSELKEVATEKVDWDEEDREVEEDWSERDIEVLMDYVERIASDNVEKMVDLTEKMEDTQWDADLLGDEIEEIEKLYDEGYLLGFKIPVNIYPADEEKKKSEFKVFLKKYPEQPRMVADEFYIRSGIYLPKEKKRLGQRPVRGFVVAEEKTVTDFLGDAEVPSHNRWKQNAGDFPQKYDKHQHILTFIRNAHKNIAQILERNDETVFENLLKDILSIPEQPDFEEEEEEGKTEEEEIEGPIEPPRRKTISTEQTSSGFEVEFVGQEDDLPTEAKIKCAYEVSRGDAFKNYSKFDFSFENGDINLIENDAEILEKEHNQLKVKLKEKDSTVKIDGFDQNRELVTRVRKVD